MVDVGDRYQRDEMLQQIIDELARSSRGRSHKQIAADLKRAIAARNLPAMPQPWIDSVTTEAVNGNAYVVSADTSRASNVPPPSTENPGEVIS